MNIQAEIPEAIWDAKRFHWNLFMQGKLEVLSGCPNALYEIIRQIKSSGQLQEDVIYIAKVGKHQFALKFQGGIIQIYSKNQ